MSSMWSKRKEISANEWKLGCWGRGNIRNLSWEMPWLRATGMGAFFPLHHDIIRSMPGTKCPLEKYRQWGATLGFFWRSNHKSQSARIVESWVRRPVKNTASLDEWNSLLYPNTDCGGWRPPTPGMLLGQCTDDGLASKYLGMYWANALERRDKSIGWTIQSV